MDFKISSKLLARFSGSRLLTGFSGGADSTAALLLCQRFQKELGYELLAVHFNHHLRGAESDREAAEAEKFAGERNIPFLCVDLKVSVGGEGVEHAARSARLEAWKKLLKSGEAAVLGHHADDRAENMLMRLCRGVNASGAASMAACSQIDGMTFLRPLLHITRLEIEEFLHSEGITRWAVDSSNSDLAIERNWWRKAALPELFRRFPRSRGGLQRSLEALQDDAEFIDSYAKNLTGDKHSFAFWKALPRALQVRLLPEVTGVPVTGEFLERFRSSIETEIPETRRIPAGNGAELLLRKDRILLAPALPETFCWNWKKEREIQTPLWSFSAEFVPALPERFSLNEAFFDEALLAEMLEIGPVKEGETLTPFGSEHPEKIKKLRSDRGIAARPPLPVVRAEGRAVWAPGIRHSGAAKVSEHTARIVRLVFKFTGDL